jgi:hypothetical protein
MPLCLRASLDTRCRNLPERNPFAFQLPSSSSFSQLGLPTTLPTSPIAPWLAGYFLTDVLPLLVLIDDSSLLPSNYGYVALACGSTFALHIYQVMTVSKWRKQANIAYPAYMASKDEQESSPAAKTFNCAQASLP